MVAEVPIPGAGGKKGGRPSGPVFQLACGREMEKGCKVIRARQGPSGDSLVTSTGSCFPVVLCADLGRKPTDTNRSHHDRRAVKCREAKIPVEWCFILTL